MHQISSKCIKESIESMVQKHIQHQLGIFLIFKLIKSHFNAENGLIIAVYGLAKAFFGLSGPSVWMNPDVLTPTSTCYLALEMHLGFRKFIYSEF